MIVLPVCCHCDLSFSSLTLSKFLAKKLSTLFIQHQTFDVSVTWQVVQRLAHALDVDGVEGAAQIVVGLSSEDAEKARALAYRLFQTAERRGWAQEAYAYNTLVTNWRDIQERVARMQKDQAMNQGGLFAE